MKLRNKKTGEIIDLAKAGLLKSDNNNHIIVYPEGTLKYYAYNSLAELNEEWEDYKPKEPLIKDEKIRKCVKLWTELNGYGHSLKYAESDGWCSFYELLDDEDLLFRNCSCSNLQNRKVYTIAELCGEDE